jgi:methyl-accepting chemotaxis protein
LLITGYQFFRFYTLTDSRSRFAPVLLVVTFAAPVLKDDKLLAVVGADIPLDTVVNIVKSIRPTPSSFAFLATTNGNVIAHPERQFVLKQAALISPLLDESGLGRLLSADKPVSTTINGVSKMLIGRRVPSTTWTLVVALDSSEALAGVHAMATASVVALVVVSIAAFFLTAALLSGPFRRLRAAVAAMQQQMLASQTGCLKVVMTRSLPFIERSTGL